MDEFVAAVEAHLATGKARNEYDPVAGARALALAQFDARVAGTPLALLLAHVPVYRAVHDLGPATGRCSVTGIESPKLRAVRFDGVAAAGKPAAMCCELTTLAFRALRYYYAVYYWTEITTWLLWRGELDIARHRATWAWLLVTLDDLAMFIGR